MPFWCAHLTKFFPLRELKCTSFYIAKNSPEFKSQDLLLPQQATIKVFIAFVKTKAYSGHKNENPYDFRRMWDKKADADPAIPGLQVQSAGVSQQPAFNPCFSPSAPPVDGRSRSRSRTSSALSRRRRRAPSRSNNLLEKKNELLVQNQLLERELCMQQLHQQKLQEQLQQQKQEQIQQRNMRQQCRRLIENSEEETESEEEETGSDVLFIANSDSEATSSSSSSSSEEMSSSKRKKIQKIRQKAAKIAEKKLLEKLKAQGLVIPDKPASKDKEESASSVLPPSDNLLLAPTGEPQEIDVSEQAVNAGVPVPEPVASGSRSDKSGWFSRYLRSQPPPAPKSNGSGGSKTSKGSKGGKNKGKGKGASSMKGFGRGEYTENGNPPQQRGRNNRIREELRRYHQPRYRERSYSRSRSRELSRRQRWTPSPSYSPEPPLRRRRHQAVSPKLQRLPQIFSGGDDTTSFLPNDAHPEGVPNPSMQETDYVYIKHIRLEINSQPNPNFFGGGDIYEAQLDYARLLDSQGFGGSNNVSNSITPELFNRNAYIFSCNLSTSPDCNHPYIRPTVPNTSNLHAYVKFSAETPCDLQMIVWTQIMTTALVDSKGHVAFSYFNAFNGR